MIPALFGIGAALGALTILGVITIGCLIAVIARRVRLGGHRLPDPQRAEGDERDWIYGHGQSGDRPQRATNPSAGAGFAAEDVPARIEVAEHAVDSEPDVDAVVAESVQSEGEIVSAGSTLDRSGFNAAEDAAEQTAAQLVKDAEQRASAIVRQAEQKASEIIASAESARAHLEREIAHRRALVDEERSRLSAFLLNLLGEVGSPSEGVGSPSEGGAANVHHLGQARKMRGRTDRDSG